MKPLVCIGDVNGNLEQLFQIVAGCPKDAEIWQLGDHQMSRLPVMNKDFHFLHGDRDVQRRLPHPNYPGPFGFDAKRKLFWLGGAGSIVPSREAEFDDEILDAAHVMYLEFKPEIVVSHTAPSGVAAMLGQQLKRDVGADCNSRTSRALHAMVLAHQPRFWIFSHFEVDWQRVLTTHSGQATQFVCCEALMTGKDTTAFCLPAEISAPKVGELTQV